MTLYGCNSQIVGGDVDILIVYINRIMKFQVNNFENKYSGYFPRSVTFQGIFNTVNTKLLNITNSILYKNEGINFLKVTSTQNEKIEIILSNITLELVKFFGNPSCFVEIFSQNHIDFELRNSKFSTNDAGKILKLD